MVNRPYRWSFAMDEKSGSHSKYVTSEDPSWAWANSVPRETIAIQRSLRMAVFYSTKQQEKLQSTKWEIIIKLEGWIKPVNVSTKVQIGDPSGIIGEPEGHHVAVPQQTDDEIPIRLCSRGTYIPKGDEEYIEPEIFPVALLSGPREPSKCKIEKHKLLHNPAMPWYDICIQTKNRNDLHHRAGPKVLPVIKFDFAAAGTKQGQPHFDFMVGTDMSTGAVWTSQRQEGSVHCLINPLMVVGARTFKGYHTVRRWVSVRSRHTHGTVKKSKNGKPPMRNHPTTITAIQTPKQRRYRTRGTNYTQPDQSVKEIRNYPQRRQASTHLVTATCCMATHAIQ